ncbi:MAG: N utilization substance protein A, partial [Bradymonadia bacterium]
MSTRKRGAAVEEMDVDLNLAIEEVARAKGIEPDSLRETLEQAMQQAAKKVFGMEREIEASYSVEDGGVQMFLVIRVADEITDPYTEITIEEAEEHGIEAEVDDELLFEIYYRNRKRDKDEAAIQDEKYGDILQLKNKRALFGRIAA